MNNLDLWHENVPPFLKLAEQRRGTLELARRDSSLRPYDS
jgi:hypothetical protein